ncbi:MAG: YggT family protein [Clostridia bacterium]|nr:YggT family protein [Clostridia bacterium]
MEFFTTLFDIVCVSIRILLSVLEFAFFARAILSFFNPEEEGFLAAILYTVTEPVVLPVRALLSRLHFGEHSPIDMSFFFAFLLLSVLSVMLPIITL